MTKTNENRVFVCVAIIIIFMTGWMVYNGRPVKAQSVDNDDKFRIIGQLYVTIDALSKENQSLQLNKNSLQVEKDNLEAALKAKDNECKN